jgi:hypothetical protein
MSGLERKSVRLADEVSTERFCPSFLEMDNSMERNVIRRVITVDTNEIHSNVHNLAGDGLVINKSKIDFLPSSAYRLEIKDSYSWKYSTPQGRCRRSQSRKNQRNRGAKHSPVFSPLQTSRRAGDFGPN